MAEFTLSADGSSQWIRCRAGTVALQIYDGSVFGGGTLTVEKQNLAGTAEVIKDDGVAVSFAAAAGTGLILGEGEVVRVTLSGATAPSITGSISWAEDVVNTLP